MEFIGCNKDKYTPPTPTEFNCCEFKRELFENELPSSVSPTVSDLEINYTDMTADVDLSGWLPIGLRDRGRIVVRKLDNSAHKILFNDGSFAYNFIERAGEYIVLYQIGGQIRI